MKRIWTGVLATAMAGTVSAQAPVIQPKLAELQPNKFAFPLCPLKPQGSVQKGVDALKKAYEPKGDKAASLAQAKEQILTAIAKEGQATNAAAWYYLARVYLMQGDVGGVDSAFSKAQALQPQCELDINSQRQNNWANLARAGFELQKANNVDGAINLFRDASRLFNDMPQVVSNLGVLFANSNREDSAAVYFARALAITEAKIAAGDTTLAEDRKSTGLNLALMYQRLDRHKEAIVALQKYLVWDPKNMDAKKALTQSFRAVKMDRAADSLENAMVGDMAKQNFDSLDTQDILAIGVAAFNAQKYQDAATAFAKGVARNPYNRDAVYNLANALLALKDWEKLIDAAGKLVAIEPMNEDVYRLLGQGHKGLKHDAEVLKAAEKLVGLQVTIEMTNFQLGRKTASLKGAATGRAPTDAAGKTIKAAPVTLVVEFLTSGGTVVDTKEVALPLMTPGATHAIAVEGAGVDIAGWRYRLK